MRALGNAEAFVRRGARVTGVAGVCESRGVFFIPHVRQPLEKQEREDVLLVVAGIDEPAQQIGGTPQVRFQLLLAQVLLGHAHYSHPPSVSTSRNLSSAARASA